jgi:hypothetical protein
MNDILEQLRNDPRVKKPEARKLDKADRIEATNSADAKKSRDVVRRFRTGSLPVIAKALSEILSDIKAKHAMQEAVDRFFVANDRYMKEELRADGQIIEWAGGAGYGIMQALPPGAPEHKVELVAAWNTMLSLVNEATKVGIHKPHREHPIMLKIDLEEPETPAILVPEWN